MSDFYTNRFGKSNTGIPHSERKLDWRPAEDRKHEAMWSFKAAYPQTVTNAEWMMRLPTWHWTHDQGNEGSCVGHGVAMQQSIINKRQNRLASLLLKDPRYDTIDIWNQAKMIDEWPDTNPGDDNGTSVHAGEDVMLTIGPRPVDAMELNNLVPQPVGEKPRDSTQGISAVRWASSVDEIRTAMMLPSPVTIGINWYSNFDHPVHVDPYKWPWIGTTSSLGSIRGGHCVCLFGVSDKRQAFALKNSWGADYPLVWITYSAVERLISEDGEVAIITDR